MTISAEEEIREKRKAVNYNTVEYPLLELSQRLETEPTSLTWDENQQSKFIESLLLRMPINAITVKSKGEKLEIIEGKQRVFTALKFLNNELPLKNLKVLKQLNGFKFCDLVKSRQKTFKRTPFRVIEISHRSDLSLWSE